MYSLRAVIATEQVLSKLVDTIVGGRIMPLGGHLSLIPITDEMFEAIKSSALERAMASCSANGPVAYVETEFFGGVGEQSVEVWDREALVLGPLHLSEDEPFPADGSPVSQALRRLGISKGDHYDEFDAVGLGRHSQTEDWL